ncbi:MAG: ABC transporter substrate-binding protein [Lachnospiraceae bacterium]
MKKGFGLTLAVVLTAGALLSGCGNAVAQTSQDSGSVQQDAGEQEESVKTADKIIVFQSKVEISDQLEACAAEYQEETGVEVEVWGTTGDDYFQQLKTKLANNQGPTVFSMVPGAESQQMAAYLADLSDMEIVSATAPGMANVIDGKTVGIPYTVEGFGMVYNKALIPEGSVTDYDSFVKMLEEQKASGINGFGLSQESYFLIGHILNTPFALQADPQAFVQQVVSGEVKLSEVPEFQEFAKFYEAVRDNSYNPLEVNYDKECGDFATGKTAAIHQGNWSAGMFTDYDVTFDMGMMALPIGGNDKLAVSVPAAWYVNSQAPEGEIQAGKDFINWLYTSDTGKNYLMNEFGFIPVVEDMSNENLDSLSQEVARFTEEGKTISWPMSDWPAGIVDVYLVPIAEEFFTTDMTGTELLIALENAFSEAGK